MVDNVGRYLAKTYDTNGNIVKGRDIFFRCQIIVTVAKTLINRIIPEFQFFPEGMPPLAAIHDNGKISPTFQEKISEKYQAIKIIQDKDLKTPILN